MFWQRDCFKDTQCTVVYSKLLTSGTKGGSTIPASSLFKLMFLKNEWALTPAAPSTRHPSLCLGSLVSSCESRDKESFSNSPVHPSLHTVLSPINAYHSTYGLGVLSELVIILLLFLLHPPLHLLPFHSLFAGAEGGSPSSHLVNKTAQPPPIRTHAVLFIVDHLWS